MSAAEIARALGGERGCSGWWTCRCPAHDDRHASLSLRDGERGGVLVHCHAGCDPRDVLAALHRLGLIVCPSRVHTLPGRHHRRSLIDRDDSAWRIALARRIWDAAQDASASPVVSYLANRGITLAMPSSLRWAPALRRPDSTSAQAMVARITGPDGELIGVGRTWLDRSPHGIWRRRDRAMLGRAAGGAVRLAPAAETLIIAEGTETTLAAMQATGMPGWAALSTSGLVRLVLPPVVRHVVICADHDRSGAGERAARDAASRWLAEGRRVRIALPPQPGTDMADVLAGHAHAEIRDAAA